MSDHRCPCGVYDEHCPHCVHRDELLEDLRHSECGKCGRPLTMCGDCYGCECDRLRAELEEKREENHRLGHELKEAKKEIRSIHSRWVQSCQPY